MIIKSLSEIDDFFDNPRFMPVYQAYRNLLHSSIPNLLEIGKKAIDENDFERVYNCLIEL